MSHCREEQRLDGSQPGETTHCGQSGEGARRLVCTSLEVRVEGAVLGLTLYQSGWFLLSSFLVGIWGSVGGGVVLTAKLRWVPPLTVVSMMCRTVAGSCGCMQGAGGQQGCCCLEEL